MATICAKNKTIGDTSCTGEAEWFNRMAATDEGAVRKRRLLFYNLLLYINYFFIPSSILA